MNGTIYGLIKSNTLNFGTEFTFILSTVFSIPNFSLSFVFNVFFCSSETSESANFIAKESSKSPTFWFSTFLPENTSLVIASISLTLNSFPIYTLYNLNLN